MLYLVLSIVSSAMISIAMRLSVGRARGQISTLSVNYYICMLLSGSFSGFGNILSSDEGWELTLILGIINGLFFFLSLMLGQMVIKTNGVVLSSIFSKVGALLIPLAFSIVFFREAPRPVQIIGALISIASIILINYQKGDSEQKPFMPILFLLLLTEGIASSGTKVFGEVGIPSFSDNFLFWTFGAAAVFSTAVALYKKEPFGIKEILFGALIGIPNFFSARFMLMAIREIPAIIVYPVRSVLTIMIITLFGVAFFKERLRKTQWIAFPFILLSLILLNI